MRPPFGKCLDVMTVGPAPARKNRQGWSPDQPPRKKMADLGPPDRPREKNRQTWVLRTGRDKIFISFSYVWEGGRRVFFSGADPPDKAGKLFSQRKVHATSTSPISVALVVHRDRLLRVFMRGRLPRAIPKARPACMDVDTPAGAARILANHTPNQNHSQPYSLQCSHAHSSQLSWASAQWFWLQRSN